MDSSHRIVSDVSPSVATQELRPPWDIDSDELYENAPCGFLTTLPDGTIVQANQTLLAWTGYERSQLIGRRRLRDLLSPGSQIYHETHYAPLLSVQGEIHEVALDVVCADGRRLPVLVNSQLDRNDSGQPRVIRTLVFNATERRSYEQELLHARRMAEESERRVRALQHMVADLAAAPTEAEVAEVAVRTPEPVFGASTSSIYLIDTDHDRMAAVASTDPSTGNWTDMPRSSPRAVARVAAHGDLRVVTSLTDAQQHFPDLADTMFRSGRNTVVLLPLTTGPADEQGVAETLGVLAFDFSAERHLSDNELRVLRLLGQQIGQALDRARLYDEARRREERIAFLAETTRVLDEEHLLLPRIRRLVDRLVPEITDWAAVRLQVNHTTLEETAGGPAPDTEALTERIAEVVAGGGTAFPVDGDVLDCVVLPLTVRGRVLGTLALRRADPGWSHSTERIFLADLADRVGLALENARLYEKERQIAHMLERRLLASDLAQEDMEIVGEWFMDS